MVRAILGCVLGLLLCGGLAAEDKKDGKIDAGKLVGKWQQKDRKEPGSFVIEFTKDGKITFTVSQNGTDTKGEGTYKLEGNKLHATMKLGDEERKVTRTISKLTDAELVSSDEKGKETTLVRVKKDK